MIFVKTFTFSLVFWKNYYKAI